MVGGSGGRIALVTIALVLQAAGSLLLVPSGSAQISPEPYHNYETLEEDLRDLAQEYTEIAKFRVIGESELGNDIYAVDVANSVDFSDTEELDELPTLYVDGGHHGNEPLSVEAAYHFLKDVLERTSENPEYLEGKRLVVTPVVNPDGYIRDYRTNAAQVDLNRNYPFHWGRYGTSDAPGHPNYHGFGPASEAETQANIELMKNMNMYAYLSGHTGTYDVVLPWAPSQDGSMPDAPLYDNTVSKIEEETGLTHREPSGAGESTAYAYGNRTAMSLVVEVSEEQFAPASIEDVEQRLDEVLDVYRLTWENLTHVGGELHVRSVNSSGVTVHNDGWGPAYLLNPNRTIPAGATATLSVGSTKECIDYQRVVIRGDDWALGSRKAPIPRDGQTPDCQAEPVRQSPAPSAVLAILAVASVALGWSRRSRFLR